MTTKNLLKKNNKGFTIVELMIATAVFSVILLVTSVGVIAIGRAYYKSLTSTRVQGTARAIMNDVSSSLQFSNTDSVLSDLENDDGTPATIKARCFGQDRYRYVINQKVEPSAGIVGLYRDKKISDSSCDTSGAYDSGTQLLGNNMRLLQFDVINVNDTNPDFDDSSRVIIKVAYGDDDLLEITQCSGTLIGSICQNPSDEDIATTRCRLGIAGNNFCAVSGLETAVTSRVR